MIRARASIATLLLIVGLMAVGFAALRVSSRLWASACFSVVLLALIVSVAELIYRRGSRRAGWAGFALFGWSYFLIAFGPAPINAWRDLLVSAPALGILEEQLLEQPNPTRAVGPGRAGASTRVSTSGYTELSPWSYWTDTDRSNPFASDSFNRIGHSLFCLGFAIGGAAFCRRLHDSRDESSPSP
jgi:hypothetical protein